jgi:hypothetical protein
VHAPTEDKDVDTKDIINEKFEKVFQQFPMYHTKILLADFNSNLGREGILKPIIGNKDLQEVINNNGVRRVNTQTSRI